MSRDLRVRRVPILPDLIRSIAQFPASCDLTVTRKGEEQACDKTAVAGLLGYFDGDFYSCAVCAYHAHMVGNHVTRREDGDAWQNRLVPLSTWVSDR